MKKNSMIYIAIIIAVIVLAGGASAFSLFSKSDESGNAKKQEVKPEVPTVNFPLETFIINLQDAKSRRFLKIAMVLELTGDSVVERAKSRAPQLRDAVIINVAGKNAGDLLTPEGKAQCKDEITTVFSQVLGKDAVRGVYFTDFVMQ